MSKPERVPPTPEVAASVLIAAAHRCCVCHKSGVQLHHINGDPSDSTADNLAPLCQEDHDRAGTPSPSTRRLDANAIRRYKRAWEARVATSGVPEGQIPLDSKAQLQAVFGILFEIREAVQRGSDDVIEAESLGRRLLDFRAGIAAGGGTPLGGAIQILQAPLERFRFNCASYEYIGYQHPDRAAELVVRLEEEREHLLRLIDEVFVEAKAVADQDASLHGLIQQLVAVQRDSIERQRDQLFARLDVSGDSLHGDGSGEVTLRHVGGLEHAMRVQVWVWRNGIISRGDAGPISQRDVGVVTVTLARPGELAEGPFEYWAEHLPSLETGDHVVGVYWEGLQHERHWGRIARRFDHEGYRRELLVDDSDMQGPVRDPR